MPQRNVHLTEHFDKFIDEGVLSGRFSDASEIVREALRLLEQRDREDWARIESLRAAAKEGFDAIHQEDYANMNLDEELDAFMKEIHAEVSADLSAPNDRG